MLNTVQFRAVDIRKQDDLRYRWTLRRPNGRVLDEGVEFYISSCLAAATARVDPTTRISVTVDGFVAGDFLAARTQLEPSAVALEIAQGMLTRQAC
ncbi:MAG: hypothetical protein ABIP61_13425 [Burkholderiaceae bacterium]